MFCSKCGKEIMDEAIVCPNCGCPTNNYQSTTTTPTTTTGMYSDDYPFIIKFSEKANTVRTLGIFAAVLMFGIGLIFTFIIWFITNHTTIPKITTTNPYEIAEFESAKRKYALGNTLATFPLIGMALSVLIAMLIVIFWNM